MEVVCEYTSGSANNVSKAVVLVPEFNEIAYAVCNLVVVLDATSQNALASLKGHEANISSVCTVTRRCGDLFAVELISCSEDGKICVWSRSAHEEHYSLRQSVKDMQHSVVSVDVLALSIGNVICACDSRGSIYMWFRSTEAAADAVYKCVHMYTVPSSQMPNCLCLNSIPAPDDAPENFLLALGGVDCKIVIKTFTTGDVARAYTALDGPEKVAIVDTIAGVLTGHEDWITCLSSTVVKGELMIASGSQDSKIRLWRFSRCAGSTSKDGTGGHSAAVVDAEDSDSEDEDLTADGAEPVVEAEEFAGDDEARFLFSISDNQVWFAAFLEALLIGHEDWVTSVHWVQRGGSGDVWQLFSTSMDRNMLLWEEAETGGVWIPTVRIGDIGGNLGGSVGANLLGFVNGVITQCGRSIIGIGYGGAFHLWQRSSTEGSTDAAVSEGSADKDERWVSRPFPTGHFGPVTDISWAPDGTYVLSSSSDQTCRLHARIGPKNQPCIDLYDTAAASKFGEGTPRWREVSRPQVHGYDLNAIVCSPSIPHQYFSGGDEKVIRVFESANVVIDGLSTLCVGPSTGPIVQSTDPSRIQRAFIPALGLSNKAASLMSTNEVEEQESRHVELMDWSEPPLEGQLADHTLWPEIRKLFGHTGDMMCIAISHSGSILATACKGRNSETSSILLWSTSTMSQIGMITSHESTVVCIRFSPNDNYIMSVSKDRGLCISELSGDDSSSAYHPIILHKNAHKRIIWDCSWCNDSTLVTGSRDGVCKVWSLSPSGADDSSLSLVNMSEFKPFDGVSVTTLDVSSHRLDNGAYILATGAETGDIKLWSLLNSSDSADDISVPSLLSTVDNSHVHGMAVKRIRWSPCNATRKDLSEPDCIQFASCGEDRCVRVFSAYAPRK